MKLIHVVVAVGAASFLPCASADEPAKAKPFVISISSEATPISHAEYRYPSYAAMRDINGMCDVSFTISTSGKAEAINVGACSSDLFRGAAKTTVAGMTFAPRTIAISGVNATIRWNMPAEPRMRTASIG